MLILFLYIKALLYNKRKDYGISKALGFTSRHLILQTALSFMPSIVLAVIGACMIVIAFVFAIAGSAKIKKIEAYKMLVAE